MSDISSILDRASDALNNAKEVIQSVVANSGGSDPSESNINHNELGIDPSHSWDSGDGLLAFEAEGAGTKQLSENMSGLSHLLSENQDLLEPPIQITPEIQGYIEGIAEARGISVNDAQADYRRFVELVNAGEINIQTAGSYGTEMHLRFGYVVGDALGIDPAFASLMSPNGGLTGPGGNALNIDGDGLIEEVLSAGTGVGNEALSYHSPTHDGFGFLNKHFETGPGYCYVPDGGDCLPVVGTDNPLSGQISGIQYWEDKLDLNPGDAVADAGSEIGREGSEAFNEISSEVEEAGREIEREKTEARVEISGEFIEAGQEILDASSTTGVAAEIAEGGAEIILETAEGGAEIILETTEGAVETGLEIGEGGVEIVREGAEGIVELGNEVHDEIKGDGVPYIPGI